MPALICSIYATTYASSLTDIVVPEVGSTDFENPVVEMEAIQVDRSNGDLHHASADAQQAATSIPESAVIKTEGLQTTESVQPHLVQKDTPGVPSKLEQTKVTQRSLAIFVIRLKRRPLTPQPECDIVLVL